MNISKLPEIKVHGLCRLLANFFLSYLASVATPWRFEIFHQRF